MASPNMLPPQPFNSPASSYIPTPENEQQSPSDRADSMSPLVNSSGYDASVSSTESLELAQKALNRPSPIHWKRDIASLDPKRMREMLHHLHSRSRVGAAVCSVYHSPCEDECRWGPDVLEQYKCRVELVAYEPVPCHRVHPLCDPRIPVFQYARFSDEMVESAGLRERMRYVELVVDLRGNVPPKWNLVRGIGEELQLFPSAKRALVSVVGWDNWETRKLDGFLPLALLDIRWLDMDYETVLVLGTPQRGTQSGSGERYGEVWSWKMSS
ncbi:hypothetical protein LTR37_015025 [Vermiconidia calcicola]|uniref:Uncharacterized protein n=1 Tax=Vermiconidia calcicola TaxID=1690605 RepID=A0ACC3MRN8_9PEZI|nr:hypothetical protein LTR37_015025 [Vermiconidia calcicola]